MRHYRAIIGMGVCALLVVFCSTAAMASNDPKKIYLRAEKWCPHNCEAFGQRQGYVIDVTRRIFSNVGAELDYAITHDETLGHTEAAGHNHDSHLEEKGIYPLIITSKTPEKLQDYLFPKYPIAVHQNVFVSLAEDNWEYAGKESLEGRTLGVTKEQTYDAIVEHYINEYEDNIRTFDKENNTTLLLWTLMGKKIDSFVSDICVINYEIDKMGLQDKVHISGRMDPIPLYLAVDKRAPYGKDYMRILDQGLKDLRESGELQRILSRYSMFEVEDWEH